MFCTWSCRWEAVKAVDQRQQIERIVKALLVLSTDRDAKTCSESRSLVHRICDFLRGRRHYDFLPFLRPATQASDFQFVLGLCVLKIILSNTSSLSIYLRGKTVDFIAAKRNANLTLETLRSWRNDKNFTLVGNVVKVLVLRRNPGLLNQMFYSAMLVCLDDNPQRFYRR